MNRVSTNLRIFAERILSAETLAAENPAHADWPAVSVVCGKLGPHLATLLGNAGFKALLARALFLAAKECPALGELQVAADGGVVGADKGGVPPPVMMRVDAATIFLAQLMNLLAIFVGETLTMQIVHEVWPSVSLNDLENGSGGKK